MLCENAMITGRMVSAEIFLNSYSILFFNWMSSFLWSKLRQWTWTFVSVVTSVSQNKWLSVWLEIILIRSNRYSFKNQCIGALHTGLKYTVFLIQTVIKYSFTDLVFINLISSYLVNPLYNMSSGKHPQHFICPTIRAVVKKIVYM